MYDASAVALLQRDIEKLELELDRTQKQLRKAEAFIERDQKDYGKQPGLGGPDGPLTFSPRWIIALRQIVQRKTPLPWQLTYVVDDKVCKATVTTNVLLDALLAHVFDLHNIACSTIDLLTQLEEAIVQNKSNSKELYAAIQDAISALNKAQKNRGLKLK